MRIEDTPLFQTVRLDCFGVFVITTCVSFVVILTLVNIVRPMKRDPKKKKWDRSDKIIWWTGLICFFTGLLIVPVLAAISGRAELNIFMPLLILLAVICNRYFPGGGSFVGNY